MSLSQADFNGDGVADLVVGGDSSVFVFLSLGNGGFLESYSLNVNLVVYVAVGDFNADGKADLSLSGSQSARNTVLIGKGDGTFNSRQELPFGFNPTYSIVSSRPRAGCHGDRRLQRRWSH